MKEIKPPYEEQQDFALAVAQVNAQVEAMLLCLAVRDFEQRGELPVSKEPGEVSCIAESIESAGGGAEASSPES